MEPDVNTPDIENIRPVNPRFFGAVMQDKGLSTTAKETLVTKALSGRSELDRVRSQMVQAQQQERLGALRIEREEFALSKAREDAKYARDDVSVAGAVSAEFTRLLDDPALSTEEKRNSMARLRLQNPD